MNPLKCKSKESGGKPGIDLARLTVFATFFTLLGDFLAFLAAVLALENDSSNNVDKS